MVAGLAWTFCVVLYNILREKRQWVGIDSHRSHLRGFHRGGNPARLLSLADCFRIRHFALVSLWTVNCACLDITTFESGIYSVFFVRNEENPM